MRPGSSTDRQPWMNPVSLLYNMHGLIPQSNVRDTVPNRIRRLSKQKSPAEGWPGFRVLKAYWAPAKNTRVSSKENVSSTMMEPPEIALDGTAQHTLPSAEAPGNCSPMSVYG